jgi:N-acetylmuramic acid 6-phosphate etherase
LSAVASVQAARAAIEQAALGIEARLRGNGRLVYAGAGTSGRLAVQDGAELMPTFNWPRERLLMLLAGGEQAMTQAVEGAERTGGQAREPSATKINAADVLIAVAASGGTPFTLACLNEVGKRGALTVGIANNARYAAAHGGRPPILLGDRPEPIAARRA